MKISVIMRLAYLAVNEGRVGEFVVETLHIVFVGATGVDHDIVKAVQN